MHFAFSIPALLAVLFLARTPVPTPCSPPRLSPKAAALVRPVLSEYLAGHAARLDEYGVFREESVRYKVFEERFYKLLGSHGAAADEAIAALLCFYVGEHTAEELICEALARKTTIRPFLLRFRSCPPQTGLEPIPAFFTTIPNLREEVLARIAAGEGPCVFE